MKILDSSKTVFDPNEDDVFDSVLESENDGVKNLLDENEQQQVNTAKGKWVVSAVGSLPLTSYMIATGQKDHKNFCFLVKPSPGSRSLNTVSYQHMYEIEEVLFVTNNHVLVKFRFGKIVTFRANGNIVFQSRMVQDYLDSDPKLIPQSAVKRGKRLVALDIKEDIGKRNLIVLEFTEAGVAECVGIFNNYSMEMKHLVETNNFKA